MALTFKSVFNGIKKTAPVIGGVIGGVTGGPGGAMAGMNIGGMLSGGPGSNKVSQYDAVPKDIQKLRTQTAGYLGDNMNQIQQTAAQSGPVGYQKTNEVGPTGINGLYRATSGTTNPSDGRYVGLNNFQPNQSTNATSYEGAASAGTGRTGSIMDQLLASQQGGVNGQVMNSLMNGGGGVSAQGVRGLTEGQQSVSDLAMGGFMDKFMQQYSPLFEQQRQQALAAAKEASGNLTGSGFANALGNSTAQTLAQQQAQLGQLAQFGIGQEVGRQSNLAGLQNSRNLADASNSLQASMANAGNRLQGASAAGQLSNQANQQMIQALEASGQIELANLVREQGRLTNNAQTGADVALQNRTITSNEQGRNAANDLSRLTTLAGLQQNDAQSQAGRDQQTNLFNASEGNSRDLAMAQLQQALGLGNRQLSAQENQFLANLLQNNNQFNASQANDVNNANAQRIAGLLGNMTTAGVGVPNLTQQPSFMDSLIGGATAAIPLLFGNQSAPGGSPAIAPADIRSMTPGGNAPQGPASSLPIPFPNGAFGSMSAAGGAPQMNSQFGQTAMGGMSRPLYNPGAPTGSQMDASMQALVAQLGGGNSLGGAMIPGGGMSSFGGPPPQANPFFGQTAGGAPGMPSIPGGAPSSIAGAPQSMQGFLAALKGGNQIPGQAQIPSRPAASFMSQLPMLRAAA